MYSGTAARSARTLLRSPVAQGPLQAAQGGIDEAVALVVRAAGVHPA